MSDAGSDLKAAEVMVYAAQNGLFIKDPDHELVAFMNINDEAESAAAWCSLISRFNKDPSRPPKGVMECAWAMSHYLIALETALGERPAKTDLLPSALNPAVTKPSGFEDDFPF